MALDQKTKDSLKQNFATVKTQIQSAFPDVDEATLSQGQSNPDQLVSAIAQSSGQSEDQIAQQLKQMVSGS